MIMNKRINSKKCIITKNCKFPTIFFIILNIKHNTYTQKQLDCIKYLLLKLFVLFYYIYSMITYDYSKYNNNSHKKLIRVLKIVMKFFIINS